jgi:enoyl-CoA hydratase
MSSLVHVEERDATLIITIDRPQQRNAINRATSYAIAAALDRLDAEPQWRAGILTGRAGNFCAGMDLKGFIAGERSELDGRGFGGLTECPPVKPLIAAVEGYALAGGCELALACDLIVAAENAQFGLPEVKRGLVAGSGGLVRLPRRIPAAIALEYALTGDRMSAADAHRWGMVNRLTPPGQALEGALALAESITVNAPLAVAMTKRIIREARSWPDAEVWERQRPLTEEVLSSDDAKEGALAFTEKRNPVWRGR